MTKSPDVLFMDAAYQRYKHECHLKYADNGPNGAFRTFDKASKSSGVIDDFPYDVDFPQIVVCELFGPQYQHLRHLAMAGFGAPFGLFAPMDAIHSRLASQVLISWINAACLAVEIGAINSPEEAEHCGYTWHLDLLRGEDSLSGPRSSFAIRDDIAGFTDDGLPVLTGSQSSSSSAPKGSSNGNSLTVTLSNGWTESPFLPDFRPANDGVF